MQWREQMSRRSRRVYWIMFAFGGVLLGLGIVEGSSVLALIGRQSTEPGITPAVAANLEFMTHTTKAVVAIFLGAMVITTCVVLATIRYEVTKYVESAIETRLTQFGRRLIGTVKVSIRRLDASLTAHDGLSDGRTEDLMKAIQDAAQPESLTRAVNELAAKAGLAIEAASQQRIRLDADMRAMREALKELTDVVAALVEVRHAEPVPGNVVRLPPGPTRTALENLSRKISGDRDGDDRGDVNR